MQRPGSLLRSSTLSVFFVALLIGGAVAKDKSGSQSLHYLTSDAIDFVRLIPPPPAFISPEQKAELEVVLRIQKQRTDTEVARAKSEGKLTLSAFTPVVGSWFTEEDLPLTAKLLAAAEAESKVFSAAAKEHFARPRPARDPRVIPLFCGDDEPSYPSGHSTRGILFASVLAELDPDRHDALFDRGREIGWDRVIAGVHYPSDVVAGRMLGQAVFQALMNNSEFQKDLEEAKKEFAEAKAKAGK